MSKAPKITDVARKAGVSTATVDRVLNARPGVRATTIARVLKAAKALGYLVPAQVARTPKQHAMRIAFVLPSGSNRVIHMFRDAIEYSNEQLAPFNVACRIELTQEFDPYALVDSLLAQRGRADGVVFMAIDHPAVRDAIKTLAEAGIAAVTLISDLAKSRRVAYVGLDNIAAGRTAGYLLARLAGNSPGQFGLIAGSLSYQAHRDRELGFAQVLQEQFPHKQLIGVREGFDDPQRNHKLMRELLKQHPQLQGVYNIGGASVGIAHALKEAGLERKVVFIGHGLISDTRTLLTEGTMDAVLLQDPQASIFQCVQVLTRLRQQHSSANKVLRIKPIQVTIMCKENLP
ncbi:LacI family DNA-binding transcriptional regulator [Lampropedia puyangensis]|uniref:LacI family DNA-binding transcriptional regulator n=1 Tax=Lampropedia puyangensis TaxID=1330072 RepID=A0A4S8FAW6_9BURK|nr:LacI family DNA-binding transcriptional regulator [Lampropedia puyangensis]THU04379.1 LacI family DNA-binding transcriptional regulator [Lampropedia puyangensis]